MLAIASFSTMTSGILILVIISISSSFVSAYVPIDVIQDEKTKTLHRIDSLNLLAYTGLLIVMVCTIWLFKVRRLRYLHETGLAIFYGLVVGAIIRYSGHSTNYSQLNVHPNRTAIKVGIDSPPDSLWVDLPIRTGVNTSTTHEYVYTFRGQLSGSTSTQQNALKATFDPELFFNLILPPIIFNAGYSMKRRFFFRNIGAIMTYAFLGTTISCLSVGFVIYAFIYWSPSLYAIFNLSDCMYFGAVISATDPVTVLAIFNDLHVDVTLYALVFGESILNDAVAITLCSAIDSFSTYYHGHEASHPALEAALHASYTFAYTFLASFLLGSGMGCLTALITKFTRLSEQPLLETALFVLMSYTAFLASEAIELSGIVAVLFCGICQAHYTYNNLSDESRTNTKQVFELLNFLCENFIFTYIGVSMFTFPKNEWSFPFIIVAIIAVLCGRALSVYPLSLLLNVGRRNKIPVNFQHVLMFSGLRGGMAFALALRNTLSEARQIMLTTTSLIVIISVIGCGGSATYVLNYLGIQTGVDENEQELLAVRSGSVSTPSDVHSPPPPGQGGDPRIGGKYEKAWLVRKWYNFDVKFMKPLLTHARPTLMETLPDCCLSIARCLTTTEQLSTEMREPTKPGGPGVNRGDGYIGYGDESDDDLCLGDNAQGPALEPRFGSSHTNNYNSIANTRSNLTTSSSSHQHYQASANGQIRDAGPVTRVRADDTDKTNFLVEMNEKESDEASSSVVDVSATNTINNNDSLSPSPNATANSATAHYNDEILSVSTMLTGSRDERSEGKALRPRGRPATLDVTSNVQFNPTGLSLPPTGGRTGPDSHPRVDPPRSLNVSQLVSERATSSGGSLVSRFPPPHPV